MTSLAAPLFRALTAAAVLALVPSVIAHGDDDMEDMKMGEADKPLPGDQYLPTYFALDEHKAAIYGHISLMVLGWVFVLPVGKDFTVPPNTCYVDIQLKLTVSFLQLLCCLLPDRDTGSRPNWSFSL